MLSIRVARSSRLDQRRSDRVESSPTSCHQPWRASRVRFESSRVTSESSRAVLDSSRQSLESSRQSLAWSREAPASSRRSLASSRESLASSRASLEPRREPLAPSGAAFDSSRVELRSSGRALDRNCSGTASSRPRLTVGIATYVRRACPGKAPASRSCLTPTPLSQNCAADCEQAFRPVAAPTLERRSHDAFRQRCCGGSREFLLPESYHDSALHGTHRSLDHLQRPDRWCATRKNPLPHVVDQLVSGCGDERSHG